MSGGWKIQVMSVPPLYGKIQESRLTDRRRIYVVDDCYSVEMSVMEGRPVLVRVLVKAMSDAEFDAEYDLLVRIRDVPQSGYLIGYCNNQTLVFAITVTAGSHSPSVLSHVLSKAENWRDKIELLLQWVELSRKLHALTPRM